MMKEQENSSPEGWRALMSPDELAAFDADGYKDLENAPRESDRISRSKRLVSYKPEYVQHQPGNLNSDGTFRRSVALDWDGRKTGSGPNPQQGPNPKKDYLLAPIADGAQSDPDLAEYHKKCIEAVQGFAEVPANCVVCGLFLRGNTKERRVTILLHSEKDEAAVYCWSCFNEENTLPLKDPQDWQSRVTDLHVAVWDRHQTGETQQAIAKALTNSNQTLTQSKVSRLLAEIRKVRLDGL